MFRCGRWSIFKKAHKIKTPSQRTLGRHSLFVRRMVSGKKRRGITKLEPKFEGGQCYY